MNGCEAVTEASQPLAGQTQRFVVAVDAHDAGPRACHKDLLGVAAHPQGGITMTAPGSCKAGESNSTMRSRRTGTWRSPTVRRAIIVSSFSRVLRGLVLLFG